MGFKCTGKSVLTVWADSKGTFVPILVADNIVPDEQIWCPMVCRVRWKSLDALSDEAKQVFTTLGLKLKPGGEVAVTVLYGRRYSQISAQRFLLGWVAKDKQSSDVSFVGTIYYQLASLSSLELCIFVTSGGCTLGPPT